MQIPLNQSSQPKRPPLELCSIKLYSTGLKKVFTNHFYKSMNHNFGIEILVRNNTNTEQSIRVGGCIYDNSGKTIVKWSNANIKIPKQTSKTWDFYVKEDGFSKMKEGKYKVQFWINDKKVQKEYFTITYK